MKRSLIAAALTLSLVAGSIRAVEAPEIAEGEFIQDGSGPLGTADHSTPTVVDWNNDGRKDLLVGQYDFGYITLFLNQGTDINPVFDGGTYVEANGTAIRTTYG